MAPQGSCPFALFLGGVPLLEKRRQKKERCPYSNLSTGGPSHRVDVGIHGKKKKKKKEKKTQRFSELAARHLGDLRCRCWPEPRCSMASGIWRRSCNPHVGHSQWDPILVGRCTTNSRTYFSGEPFWDQPFWLVGGFTTHFRTYFGGDWDVHRGYDLDLILTHSHILGREGIAPLFPTTCMRTERQLLASVRLRTLKD